VPGYTVHVPATPQRWTDSYLTMRRVTFVWAPTELSWPSTDLAIYQVPWVWRPAGFIHELVLAPHVSRRMVATALGNFALGDAQNGQYPIHQAIFLVDDANVPMLRFVRDMGCVEQLGKLFTLNF